MKLRLDSVLGKSLNAATSTVNVTYLQIIMRISLLPYPIEPLWDQMANLYGSSVNWLELYKSWLLLFQLHTFNNLATKQILTFNHAPERQFGFISSILLISTLIFTIYFLLLAVYIICSSFSSLLGWTLGQRFETFPLF